jgi:hypothetical protein
MTRKGYLARLTLAVLFLGLGMIGSYLATHESNYGFMFAGLGSFGIGAAIAAYAEARRLAEGLG